MTAAALLAEARAAGIRVTVRGDGLRIVAKRGAMSAEMRARLAAGKLELVAALRDAEATMRDRLLHLADAEGLDDAHVNRLPADDLAACEGLDDDTLRAYVRGLERDAGMDAGLVPLEWAATVHCAGCGPVWLWADCPDKVTACPWCFRRKAGKSIPRPPVQCGGCRHYLPDALNPVAGMGTCGQGKPARWPMQAHPCEAMRP